MNAETLNLYEKLQIPIWKNLNGWMPGDRAYHLFRKEAWLFVQRIDSDTQHDFQFLTPHGLVLSKLVDMEAFMLRLPLPIDPVNPERGLWGMVDWSVRDMLTHDDGTVSIRTWNPNYKKVPNYVYLSQHTTPTEALLRALIAQEGL